MKLYPLAVKSSFLVAALVLSYASPAFAGKPERDKIVELGSYVEGTQKTVKTQCGCDMKVDVKWDTFVNADLMLHVSNTFAEFDNSVISYCKTEADKKAFCDNVSELTVAHADDGGKVAHSEKTLSATLGPVAFPSQRDFNAELNKF